MRLANPSTAARHRRGVTLIEMLVVVALVILMMTILASIFQAATGAISSSRTITELDNALRHLDITIRSDLEGVTAQLTPPNDPAKNQGYFEYGENAPADLQGEDTDDYLAFTVKAPEGQSFTGRVWINGKTTIPINPANQNIQPVIITSQHAEVIYFLRRGNLYRRVLLIVPERQGTLTQGMYGNSNFGFYQPAMFGGNKSTSWMGSNDISAHPNSDSNNSNLTPVPNSLGDLTNRENRFARSRFGNDFYTRTTSGVNPGRDGNADDGNFDGIPDFYPTLTYSQVLLAYNNPAGQYTGCLMNEDLGSRPGSSSITGSYGRFTVSGSVNPLDLYAFPFVYPWMYSVPEQTSVNQPFGWLHAIDYSSIAGVGSYNVGGGNIDFGGSNPNDVANQFRFLIANQNPLDEGDSLPPPHNPSSFFGFPTFRETASINWWDPLYSLTSLNIPNSAQHGQQPFGLQTYSPTQFPGGNAGLLRNANFVPPLGSLPPDGSTPPNFPILGNYSGTTYGAPFGSDDAGWLGLTAFLTPSFTAAGPFTPYDYSAVWEDDLIMTGVRSFDVKAYDQNAYVYNNLSNLGLAYNGAYYDLGYASTDLQLALGNPTPVGSTSNFLLHPPAPSTGNHITPLVFQDGNFNPIGFGHEGRMPPMTGDNRVDPQRPLIRDPFTASPTFNALNYPNNVGDDSAGLIRLRRVWDSWSTAYTQAPAVDLNGRGSPILASPMDRPIYPSYPPPYPQPLRGIQIQIRVVDPKNEKVKILTIRQDFSDKL